MGRSGRHERVARRPRDPARARGKRRRRERRASRSHAATRRARSRGPRPKRIPARSDRGLGRIRRREDPQLRRATRAGGRLRGRLRAGARYRVRSHCRHRPRRGASALEDRARLHRERSAPSGGLAISRRRAGLGALQLLTLVAGLAIAGLAKGATAMGLPLIATPILASVFGPKQAVVIITIPSFVANTILVLQAWRVLGYLRTLVPLILANAALGLFTSDLFTLGVIACIPMLVALMAGIAVRGRLDQVRFRQVIVVLLVASVANLLWRTFVA